MSSRPDFTMSKEARKIVDVLTSMSIGELMPFSRLSQLVGFSVASTSSAYQSAKRIAYLDHQIVLASVRGVGFQRLSADEIVDGRSEQHFSSIRRRTRRLHDELGTAMLQNLSPAKMAEAMTKQGRAGVILMNSAASTTNRKAVETLPKAKG